LEKELEGSQEGSEVLRTEKGRLEEERESLLRAGEEKEKALAALEEVRIGLQKDLGKKEDESETLKARIREFEEAAEENRAALTALEDEKKQSDRLRRTSYRRHLSEGCGRSAVV